jgi:hypothetical protein
LPSAALARASARLAGDWKPALALSSVSLAVSAREGVLLATASNCSQARKP